MPYLFSLTTHPPPIHVAFYWDISRTTWYKSPPLVTCRMNPWRKFSSTRSCSTILLMRKSCLLLSTPYVICLLHFILLTSNFSKIPQFMGAMLIEWSETSVEEYSSDIPVTEHVKISWTLDSVIYMWCFNDNIKSSQWFWRCTRSPLTTELQMKLTFDRRSIVDLWETIGSPSKYLGLMVSKSK